MAINPLQAPINYAVDVQSPFQAALGGLQIGAGLEQMDAARQKRVLEMQQLQAAQAGQTELRNLFKNPNATSADYARVSAFLPKDQAAIVTQSFERLTKEQQQNDLRMGGEVYSAIKSGNIEVAKQRLTNKATSLRNSGRENEAKAAEASLELINLNPTGAQATIGLYMARLPGGTEFLANADKALATIRTEALAPSVLARAESEAQQAKTKAQADIADLRIKLQNEPNEAKKLALEVQIKEAEAREKEVTAVVAEGTQASRIASSLSAAQTAAADAAVAAGTQVARISEAQAKADLEVQKAANAVATAPDDVAKAKADRQLASAQAKKAEVDAEFARANAVIDIEKKRADIKKTDADILINKENARIAALNAAIARETNVIKRDELLQKIDEAKDKRNQATRDQKSLLDSQVADIDNFLNTAIRATNTPYAVRNDATGPVQSRLLTISQEVSDYEGLVETLGSQAFLAQIPKIRGTGSLSENEGNKLQASLQNLSLKQSPERLQENINEAVRLLRKARENIVVRSGMSAQPEDVPAATQVRLTLLDGRVAVFANQAEADAAKRAGVKFK